MKNFTSCMECGFPVWFSRIIEWDGSGTITPRRRPGFRLVLVESDVFNQVFASIEEHMGLSIGHLVFEARRNAAKEVVDTALDTFPFSLGGVGPLKRLTIRLLCAQTATSGQSYARPLSYKPGRSGEAIIRNPYNRDLMAAIVLGAFESLEKRPFEHTWKKVDGDDVISIRVAPGKPEFAERMGIEVPTIKPGNRYFERCSSCGVPAELAYLEWHKQEGMIIDRRRQVRMTFLDCYTPGVVFRELRKELGDDIVPLIVGAQKRIARKRLQELRLIPEDRILSEDERHSVYERALASLPIYGQGNPVGFEHDGERVTVRIDNPYSDLLLAGQMAGLYEEMEGREAEILWEHSDPSTIVFSLMPGGELER